ncbi:MAG: glycoside hydrolase family 2 TIM barrel-domain containing protein, partial [Thermoguttaceae bacterium]|nr:glycoside hydrolase family 2 TIM barrel-domain containing protein [Thermoguttaceae bacterium]
LIAVAVQAADWKPVDGILKSKFAKDVKPDATLQEYPRPQLVRSQWLNLNGLWDYAICPVKDARPKTMQGKILVPFAVESALSGVGKQVGQANHLWYSRNFAVPAAWKGKHVMLRFGAVDWRCEVFVNGKSVGKHQGGYCPFGLDITDALKNNGQEELVVKVWDPTDQGVPPCGKQTWKPGGIFYTSVTGIWQTVWLEPVSETYIEKITPVATLNQANKDFATFNIRVAESEPGDKIRVTGTYAGKAEELLLTVDNQKASGTMVWKKGTLKYWTPDTPELYPVKFELLRNGKVVDQVESYFALRKISLGKTPDGVVRILLNDEFLFQHGPLDQGWWPDGLYTAPTDEALAFDLVMTKKLGFNMLRKHVKVESDRFYYHCDRFGVMVWQDMPSCGDRTRFIRVFKADAKTSKEAASVFDREYRELLDSKGFFPSIVMWVPFNEGWCQFDTVRVSELTKRIDPTRLVNNTSGWTDRYCGDVCDTHAYPGPAMTCPETNRAIVLGEYGGLGLPVKGHSWNDKGKNWGYVRFTDKDSLFKKYADLNANLRPLIVKGLSAAIYTQTTDVETEVNGLMSYDREIVKMPEDKICASNKKLREAITASETAHVLAKSSWNGFTTYDIQFCYRKAKIVTPKVAAPGNPWVWRARFWGHEPQTDIAMLKAGYHVVYVDAVPFLGSQQSVDIWQEFYTYLTTCLGLSKKACLEGMSRGGLYIMNWAVQYPDEVAAIYIDNPVLDFRTWPGPLLGGGSKRDWADVLKVYELTEEQAMKYNKNPVDTCDILAKKNVPIILVNGDADKVVPFPANGKILIDKYRKAGGPIEVIMKPGCDHHPHSLPDPKPIVDFFLKYSR